ncbi:MAG TPA: ATP-binding protein [Bryobacteraceae bacterium]|nr:ATP-binding protein [Bryobacteraceae bacterium]
MPSQQKVALLSHEGRVVLLAVLSGLPGSVTALWLLFRYDFRPQTVATLTVLIVGSWLGFALAARERVVFPLQTLSNLLGALREGDFSVRGRSPRPDDALGEVMREVNTLGSTLREQRLGALEATTLLRTVMREIDVAIFAFDENQRLRLVNRSGERLLAAPPERLLGQTAAELNLVSCLDGPPQTTLQTVFPGGAGRWGVRRTRIRERGLPLELVVISDLTQALSEQELQAWQRLVRVLGHELNNSLAPIKSIAGSLESILARNPLPEDWRDDMRRGLNIITSRSESLSRFIGAYARLAKLPRPQLQPLDVDACIGRAVSFETRLGVHVQPGPNITVQADPDQLEQVLINLLRNAADASISANRTGVWVGWRRDGSMLEIWVKDEGPGLSSTANLFVPFFTTKPGGSGIGLVLSRQIAEGHGGALTLENRADGPGCVARMRLPA